MWIVCSLAVYIVLKYDSCRAQVKSNIKVLLVVSIVEVGTGTSLNSFT